MPRDIPFSDAMVKVMTPLFERLGSASFLEGVKQCYTQNSNESFNHLMWSLAPKDQHVSADEVSLALSLAVCIFNKGMVYTMVEIHNACNFEISPGQIAIWANIDKTRIRVGDYRMAEEQKIKRRIKRGLRCKKQDAFQHKEGIQYKSNSF